MPAPRLHLIGHAHIDPAWLWRWPEGLSEVLATFRSALDRIAEHEAFIFTGGSAAFYDFVERTDPAMFAEIVTAVKDQRWEIAGGFWVEPDTNVTSGEALVRQALLSQHYFATRFGQVPTVAFNPDAFGHCAGLPQILARAGFEAYVFMRPEPSEANLPRTFRWRSADGSSVQGYRIPVAYCTWPDTLDSHLAAVGTALEADGAPDGMCFYGVGNHGGGPTRANLAALDGRIAAGEPLEYSSPQRYLAGVGPSGRLDDVRGELGYHARGGYSADSGLKAAIRRTDAALIGAECAASLARVLTGAEYPTDELERAWRDLLCCGFHDVAAGTVIPSAAADALGALASAAATARRVTDEACITLAWHTAIHAEPGQTVLVVFNPHPWPTWAPVEAEVSAGAGLLALHDDAGQPVAVQPIASEAAVGRRRRITFLASLPACGWRVYFVSEKDHGVGGGVPHSWSLEVDRATGGLRVLALGAESVLPRPSAYTTVGPDRSDTWSHGLAAYPPPDGCFSLAGTEVLEDGPVRRVVRTVARYGASTLTQEYALYAGWDRVLVHFTLDWAERHRVAKLRFALPPAPARVLMEAPYANVERGADGREYPGGAWVVAHGAGGRGFALVNDAKFAYDITPTSLGLTVARSPVAAHHDPAVIDPGAEQEWLDQGRQRFAWAIGAEADPLAAARMAAELLRPAVVIAGSHHPDAPLPAGASHLRVDGAVLGAVKRAGGRPGTVLRVHNPADRPAGAEAVFAGRSVRRTLAPTELLSLYVPDDPAAPAEEVNLLEDPI